VFIAFLLWAGSAIAGPLEGQKVAVARSIEMTELGDASPDFRGEEIAIFSPDGRKFVVLTHKGTLRDNGNEYTLLRFDTENVFTSQAPTTLVTLVSTSNRPAIGQVRWIDNDTLVFLVGESNAPRAIVACDARTGQMHKISNHQTDILLYETSADRSTLAYMAMPPVDRSEREQAERAGMVIDKQLLSDLLAGGTREFEPGTLPPEVYIREGLGAAKKVSLGNSKPTPLKPFPVMDSLSVSPDGRFIVLTATVKKETIPAYWREYKEAVDPGSSVLAYFLIDRATLTTRLLVDAPVDWRPLPGRGFNVRWIGPHTALIAGLYLPLDATSGQERKERAELPRVGEVDVVTGRITEVFRGRYELEDWNEKNSELLLRPLRHGEQAKETIAVRRRGTGWEKGGTAPAGGAARPLQVLLEQSSDQWPRLIAYRPATEQRTVLLDPNPQFRHLRFGKVEEITFKGGEGEIRAGLYYPPDYTEGRRYPLVIQTHGWRNNKFWIDGPSPAGYAAQALAAHSMLVAQLPDPREIDSLREGESATETFEALIDSLETRGLVDEKRIGIMGWSRTGFHVRYALAFSRRHFAAAAVTDGLDSSYFDYISVINFHPTTGEALEQMNGGVPWQGTWSSWLERSTGFNLQRVETPARLIGFGPHSILSNWEWFIGLRYLGKPVELVWLPYAEHSPVRPNERLVSQQGNVDWFCFWLKDEEDPDPAKAEQYKRWRELRKLQEENEKKAPPSPN